jgi:mono/diheme cytochrome c family protein
MPGWKWALIGLGSLAGVAALAAAYGFVVWRSDALLQARHVPSPSAVRAATVPQATARGGHLIVVTACAGCHGEDLTGGMLTVAGSPVAAPNLTLATPRLSDAALDRAIRRGLKPDGTSELAMPSRAYAGFTDDEAAAIIGHLRELKPRGAALAQSKPGLFLRIELLLGLFRTATDSLAVARPPLDAGPQVAAGRHLAMIACGQCHGSDLDGGQGLPGPGLSVDGYYSRAQFHTLMRTGEAVGDGDMALMAHTARMSFSHFSDAEIDAIYDYLDARDRVQASKAGARP